ncbi:MAG: hypothetical protein IKK68_03580 [Paludibacteraceae bacterium]|nr:hypothetical protein [Paludibacteraceae bacterium]
MKKHLLSAIGIFAACTMSATQYMHINLPNGKEYDVKVEKTDRVSHVKEGDEVFIKVSRTDSSYSLYPLDGAEVTFDEEISRMDGDVANWNIVSTMIEGCEYDTARIRELKETGYNERELYQILIDYERCVSEKKTEKKVEFSDREIEAQSSANKFATRLFTDISKESKYQDKNLIFSPTSLQFALAMLANGADDDEAYAEITTALGKENMPLDELNDMYSKRLTNLKLVDPQKVNIGITNAAFIQNGLPIGKNFLQNIEEYYKAVANNVDFNEDSTYTKMNDWADKSTNGMIKKLGIDKDPSLILVLANALSFQSEWEEKFVPQLTQPGKFITSTGEEKQVDKMSRTYTGCYAEGENYQLVTIPFYEDFQMNVILPAEGVSPEVALAEVDFDNIKYNYVSTYDNGMHLYYSYHLLLPKFNIDTKIKLNESLKEIGLEKTFLTNFSNIADVAKVENVRQLAHLEIDEDGAKGAAVTVIDLLGSPYLEEKLVEVDVNRPFIVTINNPKTHEMLFIGLINDPTLN